MTTRAKKPRATAAAKRERGRPSKYEAAFCEQVIKFCEDGYSLAAFAGQIGVSYSTLKLWEEEHPEFSAAVSIARAKAVRWWEGEMRRVVRRGGGPGTAQLISLGLRNRAPDEWRDKQEHDHTSSDGSMAPKPTVIEFVAPSVAEDAGED